jgi:hypothetical protein
MIAANQEVSRTIDGKKVYVVGEFGFIPPRTFAKCWTLSLAKFVGRDDLEFALPQSRRRIYWHSEPASAISTIPITTLASQAAKVGTNSDAEGHA